MCCSMAIKPFPCAWQREFGMNIWYETFESIDTYTKILLMYLSTSKSNYTSIKYHSRKHYVHKMIYLTDKNQLFSTILYVSCERNGMEVKMFESFGLTNELTMKFILILSNSWNSFSCLPLIGGDGATRLWNVYTKRTIECGSTSLRVNFVACYNSVHTFNSVWRELANNNFSLSTVYFVKSLKMQKIFSVRRSRTLRVTYMHYERAREREWERKQFT